MTFLDIFNLQFKHEYWSENFTHLTIYKCYIQFRNQQIKHNPWKVADIFLSQLPSFGRPFVKKRQNGIAAKADKFMFLKYYASRKAENSIPCIVSFVYIEMFSS